MGRRIGCPGLGAFLRPVRAPKIVPVRAQITWGRFVGGLQWAAAYDEIAAAMTYIFEDLNNNGQLHEMMVSPAGDVPPFCTWEAFRVASARATARRSVVAHDVRAPDLG